MVLEARDQSGTVLYTQETRLNVTTVGQGNDRVLRLTFTGPDGIQYVLTIRNLNLLGRIAACLAWILQSLTPCDEAQRPPGAYRGPIPGGNMTREPKAPETAQAAAPARTETKTCLCGCGQPVARNFRPGHDASLKGALLRAFRSGTMTPDQQTLVALLGWERYLTPAKEDRAARLPGMRRQLMANIALVRDRKAATAERLEALHWLDRLLGGPLTDPADLESLASQFAAEAE
jgi:hypothetical protein